MSLPFENENKQVVKKLAYRSIKTQKRRNILTIITIFSAAFLMTLCGTVFASLFQIKANQGIDTYEAAFNNITEHNVLELRALGEVAQVGEYYLYGDFIINNHTATMIYVDDDMIDIGRSQINLLAGSTPSDKNEIAVTQNYLNTLDESLHVGEPIEIALGNENKTFYLSGILQSPDVGMELYSFIVSKDYIKSQSSYNEKGFRAYVHLADANNISQEELAQAYLNISEKLDLPAPSFNSAFVNYDKIPLETIMTISALALIILIGGSIVIHSIFRISVNERIHTYGQLRTIGATKRQIKGIVKREGVLVSAIGIPAGLLAGAITGFLILPKAFHVIGYSFNKTTYFKLAAFADKLESYRVNSYVFLIGQALSWFIFLFGVVNMINMQLSNQLSRKHEISIMRAVGMTQKQLSKMLISEGMIHIFLSTAIMFMIGLPSSVLITNNIGRMMYYQPMEYIFPYIPVILYILILIILQFYLTHITIKNMNKHTLLEHTL